MGTSSMKLQPFATNALPAAQPAMPTILTPAQHVSMARSSQEPNAYFVTLLAQPAKTLPQVAKLAFPDSILTVLTVLHALATV